MDSLKQPLLSIVVPTKNRYQYLYHLIDLLVEINLSDFELVIQDNSDDNSEFLKTINIESFDFINYFYQKEPVSQAKNSDLSILNSKGEYVCFIGDDDGVTRYILEAVRWMKENNVNILKSAVANYKWPSFISSGYYNISSSAIFNNFSMTYKIVNNKKVLYNLLSSGIDTLKNMPKVYNGIAKRTSLNKIYERCGSFFPGPSPDMANAVALALEEESYAYVDAPIIIGGHSAHLGGHAARYKYRYGPLEEQPFIDDYYINNWSLKIPKIWSAHTVWPESAITALKAYKKEDLLSKINYEAIYKIFIVNNPLIANMAYSLCENRLRLKLKVIQYFFYRKIKGVKNVIEYKTLNKYDGMKIHRGVQDIVTAEAIIVKGITEFRLKQK